MWRALLVSFLVFPVFGQTTTTRVAPEEAEKHLLKNAAPVYPPLAKVTNISGTVILEVVIDPSGSTSVLRVISGHPLLVPAAIDAAKGWKYQSFEADGKALRAITFVMVPFGRSDTQEVAVHAEMQFLHNFWTADESAQVALSKGDEAGAAEQLDRASSLLAPISSGRLHEPERAQWMKDMGDLRFTQKKYDESEEYYKKALGLLQDTDKESSGTALAQANLARLYAAEQKYDLAREQAAKSVGIYKKHFKAVGSKNPVAQQTYGAAIARLSWMLSRIATEKRDHSEAVKQCKAVLDFQVFVDPPEKNLISTCQALVSEPAAKN